MATVTMNGISMSYISMYDTAQAEPKYKVRAIRDDGSRANIVGGWGESPVINLVNRKFYDAEDVTKNLLPSIRNENEKMDSKIVRLEVYMEREENVASMDLEVKPSQVITEAGEWERLY